MPRITTQIVLLAAVPLTFLLMVLGISLALQSHNADLAASSQATAQVLADANRAIFLVEQADGSLAQFSQNHSESAANSYLIARGFR